MVYESRWQQIIFATEIYRYFGTDLQIQYINSAMKEIVDILKIYENKGWVKIEPFAFFDFDSEDVKHIGMNPNLEFHARNLPLAFTDCLMKFRESSEFIIIADVDDILFPKHETFFDEFLHLRHKHPTAVGFMYHRSYAKIDVAKHFYQFSISETIQTLKVAEPVYFGKTVYQPKYAETAWIHNPGLNNDSTITVPKGFGRMFHVQVEDSKIRKVNDTYFFGEKEDLKTFKDFNPIPKNAIEKIMTEFILSFKDLPNFQSNNFYTDILFECNKNHEIWNENLSCLTPFQCIEPKTDVNLKCVTAKRNYSVKYLNDHVFYLPNNEHFWESRNDGCQILTN
uniref:Glycosyltransferase family 92 protein n=1 Tax=Panagrolaimus davidi TaxID=227884 RepID=A0A914P1S5_9BILA